MRTGTAAASTQPIWKRVSNRAKARPRLASGASRCTIESNASRAEGGAEAHDGRQQRRRGPAAEDGGDGAADGGEAEGGDQHPLLLELLAHEGADGVAGERADGREDQHHAEPPRGGAGVAEPERDLEREEAHDRPQQGHGRRRQPDPARAQLGRLDRLLALGAPPRSASGCCHAIAVPRPKISAEKATVACGLMSWKIDGGHAGGEPDHAGDAGRASSWPRPAPRRCARGSAPTRALADGVRLRQHELVNATGNSSRPSRWVIMKMLTTRLPAGAGDDDDPPAAGHAVDGRADERRHDRERQHREQQVERHLAAGGLRADVEEERAGQRDGDDRIARRHEGVGAGEAGEGRHDERPAPGRCSPPSRPRPGPPGTPSAGVTRPS